MDKVAHAGMLSFSFVTYQFSDYALDKSLAWTCGNDKDLICVEFWCRHATETITRMLERNEKQQCGCEHGCTHCQEYNDMADAKRNLRFTYRFGDNMCLEVAFDHCLSEWSEFLGLFLSSLICIVL